MAKKKFYIREEPTKPDRRKDYGIYMPIDYPSDSKFQCVTLRDILKWVEEKNISPEYVTISVEIYEEEHEDTWRADLTSHFSITGVADEEPEEYFQEKMEKYEKNRLEYVVWSEENKEKIEEELHRREVVKREKAQKTLVKIQAQQDKLDKKKQKVEKDLI